MLELGTIKDEEEEEDLNSDDEGDGLSADDEEGSFD